MNLEVQQPETANSRQIGGSHYQTGTVQHWDVIDEHDVPYLEGCATKYISRHRRKSGRQDLEKALHFIDKTLEREHFRPVGVPLHVVIRWARLAELTALEMVACTQLLAGTSFQDIRSAREAVEGLLQTYDVVEKAKAKEESPVYWVGDKVAVRGWANPGRIVEIEWPDKDNPICIVEIGDAKFQVRPGDLCHYRGARPTPDPELGRKYGGGTAGDRFANRPNFGTLRPGTPEDGGHHAHQTGE